MATIHRNTFDGGLDTNTSHNLIQPNKYIEAKNVNIATESNFFALENVRGTTSISDIISSISTSVLGVFATNYKIGSDTNIPCLTIITALDNGATSTYKIWAHDLDNNTVYELYEETFDGRTDFFTNDRVCSAFVYPENGIDVLYFTDFYNELRKLNCNIATPYVANALTDLDLKLLTHGANGYLDVTAVEDGGSLFCGAYQFAYQLLNPSTGQSTKFSLFSNPIQVYLESPNAYNLIRSGVGVQSNKKIALTMYPTEEELDYYTHFRFAVLENIEPSGVNVDTAQLTQLEALSDYTVTSTSISGYEYTTNTRLETIALSEIVVDKAAIATAKTLAVRDNRLVCGNITYKDLTYDQGSPIVSAGEIIKQSSSTYDNLFSDPLLSSKYRGYFRDEVYRFAISYFDKDGNYSYPEVLDLTNVTNNQITGDYKDMKFPARSQKIGSETYSLFKNGQGIQSLGLRLTIDNHPSWAQGFVILRAKRLKNILFQTPLIPMNHLYGVGAIEDYPVLPTEVSGTTGRTVSRDNDTPMGPFETYAPRNYFLNNATDIRQFSVIGGSTGTGKNRRLSGEAYITSNPTYELGMIFPPEFMYENQPFVFSPNYRLKTVDAALLKTSSSNFSDINIGSTTEGKNIKTSVSGTFYALKDSQYYYDSVHSGAKPAIGSSAAILNDYEAFDNFSSGSSLGGFNLFRYDKLTTGGSPTGVAANTQKCGVVKLDSAKQELNYQSTLSFTAGTQVAKNILTHSQEYELSSVGFRQTVEIVNVEAGLEDERYGKFITPHEFISTGAHYIFDAGDLSVISSGFGWPVTLDVWGGDCYVTPHLFKLTDTSYGVTNSEKFISLIGDTVATAVQNWERVYSDIIENTNCVISTPVPFKNSAQYMQIILESEYNGGVIDNEVVNTLGTDGILTTRMPILGLNTDSEGSARVPLTYQLNQNHKKQNSDKIFRIKDPLLNTNLEFGARLIYSDQKVYHTSIAGFDTFRVLNVKDLEELYGDIYSVSLAGNDLFALQEKAVTYIGIGERTLETTDALTLSVQTGSFIGNTIMIDNNRGTQHLQSVCSTGNAIYFLDNFNQTINRISGKRVEVISENGLASSLRGLLDVDLSETKVQTIYDPIRKQIWFSNQTGIDSDPFCYVFDEARNMWVSNLTFPTLYGGAFINNKLYLVGVDNLMISTHSMYTGERTSFFGQAQQANVVVVANPVNEMSKRFDVVTVVASNPLDFMNVSTPTSINQSSNGTSLDVSNRGEGTYKIKILRDAAGARMRGQYATLDFKWKNDEDTQAKLASILTNYTISV